MAYKSKEDERNYNRKWRNTPKGKEYIRKKNARYRVTHPNAFRAALHKYNTSEKGRANHKRWRDRVKAECIAAYGGKCSCCGESRPEFLTADHVNGGGAKHRKELKGINFWYWLRKQGFPKGDFRLLCWNCNGALGTIGYCPHDREREALAVSSSVA